MEILLRGVSFSYQIGGQDFPALKDINLIIHPGELLAITGEGGSGKSTLAQIIAGLLKPTQGQVYWNGRPLWDSKKGKRRLTWRGKVGLAFQQPEQQLFAETVAEDVAFGPRNLGLPPEEVEKRVKEALKRVGLDEEVSGRSPFTLSGGQKRRAALAGILALDPEILILDEPTAGLDPGGRRQIIHIIREFHSHRGKTVILISHNMAEVSVLAQRMIVLHQGQMVLSGTPAEVFAQGERLGEWGLVPPPLTQVLLELNRRGASLNLAAFTLKEVEEEIWRWLSYRGRSTLVRPG
ncbi:energy-coupling factor transport system ATP-binding protein [Thermanaeromonas toyohensis ToBE]|uniref:Energy-coupling factor transport system ATP-binding protein n=1 Tax=Thermanaeromonas toyohensis ToBE TaxID=698762 RepID=A0A1W1V6S4_9FIRM|nr:energy-coupling factor transporter ATPase [Thermanaeromonas toyohensis]SMB88955.1 energy-coupling factor transport system ATP-binding protein [Thermanaeromonas toyohensis ToBE]